MKKKVFISAVLVLIMAFSSVAYAGEECAACVTGGGCEHDVGNPGLWMGDDKPAWAIYP